MVTDTAATTRPLGTVLRWLVIWTLEHTVDGPCQVWLKAKSCSEGVPSWEKVLRGTEAVAIPLAHLNPLWKEERKNSRKLV